MPGQDFHIPGRQYGNPFLASLEIPPAQANLRQGDPARLLGYEGKRLFTMAVDNRSVGAAFPYRLLGIDPHVRDRGHRDLGQMGSGKPLGIDADDTGDGFADLEFRRLRRPAVMQHQVFARQPGRGGIRSRLWFHLHGERFPARMHALAGITERCGEKAVVSEGIAPEELLDHGIHVPERAARGATCRHATRETDRRDGERAALLRENRVAAFDDLVGLPVHRGLVVLVLAQPFHHRVFRFGVAERTFRERHAE